MLPWCLSRFTLTHGLKMAICCFFFSDQNLSFVSATFVIHHMHWDPNHLRQVFEALFSYLKCKQFCFKVIAPLAAPPCKCGLEGLKMYFTASVHGGFHMKSPGSSMQHSIWIWIITHLGTKWSSPFWGLYLFYRLHLEIEKDGSALVSSKLWLMFRVFCQMHLLNGQNLVIP